MINPLSSSNFTPQTNFTAQNNVQPQSQEMQPKDSFSSSNDTSSEKAIKAKMAEIAKENKSSEPITLRIISTNDMHGKLDLMPKVSAVIKDLKAKHPDAIVVDGGDTAYNPPFSTSNKFKPVTDMLNAMNYDIINLGNHEFQNNKDETVNEFISQVNKHTDVLAGNVHYAKGVDLPGTSQYVIKELNGVKVAFVGLVEPNMGTKPNPQVGADLYKESTADAMKRLMPELKEKADVIVAMSHEGIGDDKRMLAQVDGVDLVLAAHDHAITESPIQIGSFPNQTYIVEGGSHCKMVSYTELTYDPSSKEITGINFKNYPIQNYSVKPDQALIDIVHNYKPQPPPHGKK